MLTTASGSNTTLSQLALFIVRTFQPCANILSRIGSKTDVLLRPRNVFPSPAAFCKAQLRRVIVFLQLVRDAWDANPSSQMLASLAHPSVPTSSTRVEAASDPEAGAPASTRGSRLLHSTKPPCFPRAREGSAPGPIVFTVIRRSLMIRIP